MLATFHSDLKTIVFYMYTTSRGSWFPSWYSWLWLLPTFQASWLSGCFQASWVSGCFQASKFTCFFIL